MKDDRPKPLSHVQPSTPAPMPALPVVGEICPVGTLAKLRKMTALVKQLRELL